MKTLIAITTCHAFRERAVQPGRKKFLPTGRKLMRMTTALFFWAK
jgi:hypothetical protein